MASIFASASLFTTMNEENKPKLIIPKANDSFAQVELFLWQYGELPRKSN